VIVLQQYVKERDSIDALIEEHILAIFPAMKSSVATAIKPNLSRIGIVRKG
jgi:hypothetical protein